MRIELNRLFKCQPASFVNPEKTLAPSICRSLGRRVLSRKHQLSGSESASFGALQGSLMLAITTIEWLFGLLVLIVFTNRYVFGSLLRVADRRTEVDFNIDPPEWPSVAIIVPVFCEGESVLQTAASFAA